MKTSAPLSKTQYGIYAECVTHQGEVFYNLPYLYTLDGSLDGERLCRAIEAAVMAHPTLFTRIELNESGDPMQHIDGCETFTLAVENTDNIEEAKKRLVVPFNIYGDRLFHANLLHDRENYYFFLDIHHIIGDGTSLKVMLTDINTAYNGGKLHPEQFTLAQIAESEASTTPAFEEGKQWYAKEFDYGDLYTPLMPDIEMDGHREASMVRTLGVEMSEVNGFCEKNGIFRSTFFTSAYSFLLAKYNNSQASLFTTVYNGRNDKRFHHSVGMTVKKLPVYGKFTGETTVLEFLKTGQEQMSGVRRHEAYAFCDLVNDIEVQSNTIFAWHGMLFAHEELCGKPMKTTRLGNSTINESLYIKAFILHGKYLVKAEYNSNKYSEELIAQFLASYEAAVTGFLKERLLQDISIVDEEQAALLNCFNHTDVEYDNTQTIVSLFRSQAKATPENTAVVYKKERYTYKEVDELSDRIACHITKQGLGAEDVVSVLIPRSEWMVIASLGALKAGCAYQPLAPDYPKERLNFMMQDANVKLLIADEELRSIVDEYNGCVLLTKDIKQLPANDAKLPEPNASSLFILLYTSGSTGIPKGCELTHGNLVCFCHWYQRYFALKPEHNVAAYASYGFDACMMDMYPALTSGATVHIVPEEIRLDLVALNNYFEHECITHSFMTTQVGYQFATSIENHSLQHLSTGGEKLASMVPPKGYNFYNGYGPTECTIFSTIYQTDKKLEEIPIGKPLDNMRLYVVDTQGHRQPVGALGELWISGPQVSRGYLNRPEKTAEAYIDNPFTSNGKYARVYRSGDIVRYLPSGDIQFVGRRDGQVKIRGFRIELKEIEAIIREFPGIKDATVQAFDEESGNGKFIAAYIVGERLIDIEALNDFILEQKPPYMVPAVTMQIESIPLNQNQKVNRRALPKPEREAAVAEECNAPMNILEKELHEIIGAIVNHYDFGITTVLGHAGLTSISAIKLAVQVNKRYGVALDSKQLVKGGTLQSIENEILKGLMTKDCATGADHARQALHGTKPMSAPLSYAQTGVYFDCLKNPASTIYNIPYLLSYPPGVEGRELANAVKTVVEAHPELSIHFTTKEKRVLQTIKDSRPIEIPVTEMSEESLSRYKNEFVRPFNIQRAPLYRFEVVKTERRVHLLMDIHHLVFDGGSADLIIRQITAMLEGKGIERENYTYLEFVCDQQKAEQSDAFKASQQFFAEKLQNCEGASEIPADLPKTEQKGHIGEAVCPIDIRSTADFCLQQGITPAHLFLAATCYVVSRYTNNRDVFLSTISSGRSNLKIADTVGMFVNTLALGLKIDDVTVAEYLQQASETFDETLRNENYPFARIATDYGFTPSIAYAYQVGVLSEYMVNGQRIEQELLELNVPKFKINIKIEQRGVVVQYDDALYSARLGNDLAESIVATAGHIMAQPQMRVRSLSIVSKRQEDELCRLRQVATAEVPFKYYHDCIGYHAQRQPEAKALIASDAAYTFAELDKETNRIANALRLRGVTPRSRVALMLPRTSRIILSVFGVMKAGCAYIPCDPEYPAERIQHILNDSNAAYIITTADRVGEFTNAIDVEELLDNSISCTPIDAGITPQDLCYLIYTSGSTGKPKGVMLRHESIANYLYNHPANTHIHALAESVHAFLCVTTFSFDMSMKEFGSAIFNGKTIVLANEDETTNAALLAGLILRTGADAINATPSRMLQYMELPAFAEAIGRCRVIMCGGEKYADGLLDKLRAAAPEARIFNTYGPTEITVSSNCKELTHTDRISVGHPLLNYKEFVVDSDGNELPVGVVGELYIGGAGVATGYNNLPEMTAERFINYKGTRIYKSGDYACWTREGDIVILGRTDNQIKLRGLRIELGEVEAALSAIKGIKNAVVKIGNIKNMEHLCAYFTADRPIDIAELKEELGKTLTRYMVPTAYLQMEKMPLTPNGKTDMKALPEPQLATSNNYEAPANDTERAFCDIFASVLQMDRVGATDNFFELGGTSLVVTSVIIEADKAGLHVSYGEVFDNPTPRQLALLVKGETTKQQTNEEKDAVAGFDYTAIDNLLQRNTLKAFLNGKCQQPRNVLITGSTGYLGIHILHELIESDCPNIYCMVRGKTAKEAEGRLCTLLFYYFSKSFKELLGKRLHIITGDVTEKIDCSLKVDTVFNCAAVVKHFSKGTEIEDVNVGGANNCVEFCIATGARLIHISTASTRGLWVGDIKDDVYTEQRLYMGQYLGNQYIHSKYMAERIILDSVALHGLDAKIMRVGNLAARSTDGEFQANFNTNSFMGRIRIYNMLGCCPHSMRNKRVEFSPINEAAKAIVLLAATPKECTVFHPYNIHNQFLGDVLLELHTVTDGVRFVEENEFQQAMDEAGRDPQKAKQMAALLAYKDMAHGKKSADVQRDNDYTTQVLYRLGFNWSPTSWDYVERMFAAIGGLGFFD